MAKNRSPQPGKTKSAGNQKKANPKANKKPNTKGQAPKKRSAAADPLAEAPSAGDAIWYLAGLLCTGAIIFAILFASVVGGDTYTGPKHTPKPPIEQNVSTPNLDNVQNEESETPSSPQPDSPTPPSEQSPAPTSPSPAP